MIHPHMCMTKDAVNLLQRRIEAMAGGFISGPIVVKIDDYMYTKILQKGKAATVKVGYHKLVRKCAMRIQNRVPAAYSIASKYIEQELPIHTYDAIGIMDVFMGQISEMFRQYGISDDPPAAANMMDGSLHQERAMYIATHSPDTIAEYGDDEGCGSAALAGDGRKPLPRNIHRGGFGNGIRGAMGT